ncbi:MAG: ABC transporter substrate-binding protein [Candidatus Thorarchaeota archaeon]
MHVKKISLIFCIFMIISFMTFALIPTADADTIDNKNGPYVDKIVYSVITQDDQQVLALMDDEIDLIGDMVDPTFLATLLEAEDIDVANVQRNGYGYVVINTQKYPLNITAFRRATAFALDKEGISDTCWDGLSQPGDSPVPTVNPWTIEGQLPYTYYEANVALGNQLLDDAGFVIDPVTGFREAPNGAAFDVLVECAQSSNIAIEVGQYVADALDDLSIDAASVPTDFYEYLNRLYFHGDFDMVFMGSTFTSFDVDWLAYEFWSEYADEPYQNFAMFANDTYDSWREQLLYATTYEEVYEAAIEMQRILVYQVPYLVCYANQLLSAYRTDRFEGHVNDVSDGVPGWWTNYKVHLKDSEGGPAGGTFRWSNPMDIDTFNFMVSSSPYANNINMMMWESLIRIGPDGNDLPWLAEDYLMETHEDNPSVPDGYTQMTFNLIQNATWTDGMPLTAEDVAFSLNYYRNAPGNPYGPDLTDMIAAYAPTTYTLIVQFSSVSFWHLHTVAYKPVLPKHVFEVIGVDGWNIWNPNPPITAMVTSGPFNVSDYVAGEYCEMTRNPDYFYGFNDSIPSTENEAPTINHPSDIVYELGTIGHSINWTATDDNPSSYLILKDSILFKSGLWNSSTDVITVDVDGLSLGINIFTITVTDTDFASASDTVFVSVVDSLLPGLNHPADFSFVNGTTGNELEWSPSGVGPFAYSIYVNDVLIESGSWSSSSGLISINLDYLAVGLHTCTITMQDGSGNVATDTVKVTVVAATTGTTTITQPNGDVMVIISMAVTIGSVVVIIVVVILIKKGSG